MGIIITSFKDLKSWQEAHKLVLSIYKITAKFPDEEKFALINQMRRSAISITSNIAEGFSRNTSKDKIHFYQISKGSLSELESQLLIARDLVYVSQINFDIQLQQIELVSKLLTGMIRSAPSR